MSLNSGTTNHDKGPAALRGFLAPWHVGLSFTALMGLLVVLWPLGLTSDYLNHLARNYIEAQIWFDAVLQKHYAISFDVIPDLTMDMIVPWLAHLTGVYAAGAATVWIAYVAPPLAGLLIARTVHGRITWLSLAGFLTVFNENMQWGFVNYTASTGLALLGLALWMRCQPGWRRATLFAPFCAFLSLNHALGFLLFGYLVLLWEIACFAQTQRGSLRTFVLQLATKDILAMAPGLVVIAMAMGRAQELTRFSVVEFALLPKLMALFSGTSFFNPLLAILVTTVVASALYLGFRRGILHMERRMAWICLGMLALVILIPMKVLGIWGLHFRYPGVLLILTAAGLRLGPGTGNRVARPIAIAATTLFLAVFFNGALQMSRIDREAHALRAVISELSEGVRVLTARDAQADVSFALHSAAMAVIERSAFVPNLFTNTSPVDVRPEMRPLHMPQAWPLLGEDLAESMERDLPKTTNGHWSPGYYYGWPEHWDYVLFFRSQPDESLDLPPLCLTAERPRVALYRVALDGCPASPSRSPMKLP